MLTVRLYVWIYVRVCVYSSYKLAETRRVYIRVGEYKCHDPSQTHPDLIRLLVAHVN